jgi:hypothetical protein
MQIDGYEVVRTSSSSTVFAVATGGWALVQADAGGPDNQATGSGESGGGGMLHGVEQAHAFYACGK